MIVFDNDNKIFFINGKDFSYVMYVNDKGFIQNLYYGKKIEKENATYLIDVIGKRFTLPDTLNWEQKFDNMPSECGFYGRGDYREPTVLIERQDGSKMSRFRYKEYTIKDGAVDIKNMPHAKVGGQTLSITLKDDFSDTEIILNYTVWEDSDILVRNLEIKNVGEESEKLNRAFSYCFELPCGKYSMLRLRGRDVSERNIELTEIGQGITKLQSLKGASSHAMNPFMAILRDKADEDTGDCFGVQLIYSGSYTMTAEVLSDGPVRMQGGICDYEFTWELNKNESFVTPQVALCYSNEGLGKMSREYSDFLREHIIPKKWVKTRRPIVVNNWEATYFDFDNEKLYGIIDEASKLGIDTFVLDDGWFGTRNNSLSGLGDWTVNENKLKGGLKAIINHCKEKGMKFGLWFEPEMVNEDSDLYREHPDFAICKAGTVPMRKRFQLVLDFTKQEVIDYVYNKISSVLKNNDISYVKWDMNRYVSEYYSNSLPTHRQGEFLHRHILGVYQLAERLTSNFPDIIFEGCAGGGGRFDAGMLYYFPQIWTSDDTDAYERTKIQWGTSMCYPLSAMSCHVSVCPNHQTGRTTPFSTRGAIASLGATGYELNVSLMSVEEKEQVKEQIKNYKEIDELILKGDMYRLSNPFKEDYFCEMVVSKDKQRAYLVGEQNRGVPGSFGRIIKLKGLDENKTYYIKEIDKNVTGNALMNVGILLPELKDYESWIWHLN